MGLVNLTVPYDAVGQVIIIVITTLSFGHSAIEWPSVDAPAALGPNGPWAAGASTLGHSIA